MKKHKKLFNVFTGVLLVALLVIGVGWSIGEARSADRGDMVEVLIGFKGKPGPAEHRLIKSQGGKVTKELNRIDVLLVELPAHNVDKVIVALENVPNISFVEENGVMEAHIQTVPWGIARVFGDESYSFETWKTTTGGGIGVAILDTGIDVNHKDLNVKGGYNAITKEEDNWNDENGHGTHVAGTVVALDNDQGVVGVAPQIDLYAVKVLDDNGSGSVFTVAAGIDWAVNQENIDIINMSLGGGHHQTLELAVKDAYEAGVLMVASAGNSGPRPNSVGYPAAYPEVIAVSATDRNDGFASFSSRGRQVELTAPGVNIYSTLPNNKYGTYSGTSMASPHVAGVAALVWATNPKLTHEEVRTILQETAENIGLSSDRQGHGLIRADLAVKKALENQPDPITDPEPIYTVKIEANDQTKKTGAPGDEVTYSFTITNTGTEDDTYDISVDTNGWSATTSTSSITIVAGGFVDITVTHSIPDGATDGASDTGTLKVSSNNASSTAIFTTTVKTTTDPDDPNGSNPSIDNFELNNTGNRIWARMTIDWAVSGENLSEVKIDITEENSESVTYSVSGSEASGSYEFRARGGHGDYTVELTVTDGNGTVSETKNITL